MSATGRVIAFPSTRSRLADDLRRTLIAYDDRGWLNYRIVAKIIGATSSQLFRFIWKGEPTLTPRHLRALETWRDEPGYSWMKERAETPR